MKRLLFLILALLVTSSVWAASKVQVMTDGKIDVDRLPTISFFQDSDPASPELGQLWWNNSTAQLKVAGALGVYAFNATSLVEWDTTPEAFSFTDVTNATTNSTYTSAPITVAGINWPAPISVSGDASAKYTINSGTATSSSGTVESGDEVRAVVTSSASDETAVNATVTIGGVSDAYSVTTATAEEPPSGGGDVACNGTFASGDIESFESGTGEFCTSGWTIGDSTGFDTHSSDWSMCGNASLAITTNSTNNPFAYTDLGAGVGSKYVRAYIKPTALQDNRNFNLIFFHKWNTNLGAGNGNGVAIRGAGASNFEIVARDTTEPYFSAAYGDVVRVECFAQDYDGVNNKIRVTIRAWKKNGATWDQLTSSASSTDIVNDSGNYFGPIRYLKVGGSSTQTNNGTVYVDDLQIGSDWVGGASCAE